MLRHYSAKQYKQIVEVITIEKLSTLIKTFFDLNKFFIRPTREQYVILCDSLLQKPLEKMRVHIKNVKNILEKKEQNVEPNEEYQRNPQESYLKQFLSELKNLVDNPGWDKKNRSYFFYPSTPTGIKELRKVLHDTQLNELQKLENVCSILIKENQPPHFIKKVINYLHDLFFRKNITTDCYEKLLTLLQTEVSYIIKSDHLNYSGPKVN